MELWIRFFVLTGICLIATVKSDKEIENPDLNALVSTFWEWRLREWPTYGTKYGFHQYDMYLDNFTEEAFTSQRNTAVDLLKDATDTLNEADLNDDDAVTLAVLKDLLSNFIEGYEYRKYSIYNSLIPGYENMVSRMLRETLKDYQNILARYRQMEGQIEDILVLLKEEAKLNGTTAHPSTVMRMISTPERLYNEALVPENSFLYQPFEEVNMPDSIDNTTWSEMQAEVLELIQLRIMPALQNYITYIKTSYGKVNSVNRRNEPGLYSVSGGEGYYKACLKWHLTTDITAQEIHATGLKEVERIGGKMAEIMKSQGFEGSLEEYMDHLKQDPKNFYSTSEEVLQGYENIISDNHDRLPQVLLKIPDFQVIVVPTRGASSSGSYTEPPLDGSTPATFNANTKNPHEILILNMDALTLHEAEPGHHTQTTYAMESGIPTFRKLIEYLRYESVPFNWLFHTAYTEGWALYAELLGVEMGSYTDPLKLFGKYNSEIYRAVRLVVDTGIHAFGWSIEQAQDYMRNHTTLGELTIKYEILRYVAIPGQACAYKIGELKIRELRKEAEDTLGPAFDKREFHDAILRLGPVSLSIMEDQVHKWMEKKSAEALVSSGHVLSAGPVLLIFICLHLIYVYQY